LSSVIKRAGTSIYSLSFNLVCPAPVIAKTASRHGNIHPSKGQSFSIIESFDGSKKLKILIEQCGKLDEKLAALFWCCLLPGAVECLAGR
jgi:hypothetical protein